MGFLLEIAILAILAKKNAAKFLCLFYLEQKNEVEELDDPTSPVEYSNAMIKLKTIEKVFFALEGFPIKDCAYLHEFREESEE